MSFPLGAGARRIEANPQLPSVSQPIDTSPAADPKTPHSRLGASSAHITELCYMMQTYERHKQWAVEQRRLTIRAPISIQRSRPQLTTNTQSADITFSSASHLNTSHTTTPPSPKTRDGLGPEGALSASTDHDTRDKDRSSISESEEDDLSDDMAVQPSDNSSTELCKPRPATLPSLASILAPAPTSLAQYRLSSMQRRAPEQKQEALLSLFAELSQERIDSLVGLVRLVAAVPDGQEGSQSLSSQGTLGP